METNPNALANAIHPDTDLGQQGLTKREYFAGLAMQGLRANPDLMLPAADAAIQACNDADALIIQLNKSI